GNLDHARVVVGVGMGIGGPKNVEATLEVIQPLHAALGATRRVVDEGWVPAPLQVGLTGRSIAPDLYIAVGISGQVNHMVGVKRARVTVGINSRPGEPLFSGVDVGIIGDGLEVLRELVRDLSPVVEGLVGGPQTSDLASQG
ncbi:MAG TPA: FAD-binding protein, partial [Thermoplasmata archaeon]|nr:FAD-binding protein [Thermoplasmata archaeon]